MNYSLHFWGKGCNDENDDTQVHNNIVTEKKKKKILDWIMDYHLTFKMEEFVFFALLMARELWCLMLWFWIMRFMP